MVFVYLLLSLMVTAASELVSAWFKWRAKNLEAGIQNLLHDPAHSGLAKALYDHGLLQGLSKGGKGPSYIPSRTFALALLDIIDPADALAPRTKEKFEQALSKLPNGEVKRA